MTHFAPLAHCALGDPMIKIFVKILWRQFLVSRLEHLLVSSETLSCKTHNILTLSMLVSYYNTNSKLFSKKFLTYALISGWSAPVHY